MHGPTPITGLSEVAPGYGALLCDAWGVIHNGKRLFPGVAEALVRFREAHGPVIILTNAPRLSDIIPEQLDKLGLPRAAYDAVVTSGDATLAEVRARSEAPFFRLGPDKDDTVFEAAGVAFVEADDAEFILCTGLFDDLSETPDDYRDMLSGLAAKNLPMICANPDKVVKYGDRLIYCAGALGDLYEELGGEVILGGKPHAPIYRLAREKLAELADQSNSPSPLPPLAIGDGFQTDILGANNQDIEVIYVADGIYSAESRGEDGALDPAKVDQLLSQYGVHAAYVMEGLTW